MIMCDFEGEWEAESLISNDDLANPRYRKRIAPRLIGLGPHGGGPGGIRTPNLAVMSGQLYH